MILRQNNYLAGMRIDVPTLRAIDSAGCGDFDMLIGRQMAGSGAYVVRGMTLVTTNAVGQPAAALTLTVADSIVINLNASVSGSMLWVPTTQVAEILTSTNPNVTGSFTANTTNYIGLDLTRTADASTTDLVKFIDANTDLEISKEVPLARTMGYKVVIGTQSFASQPNLIPIAIIQTDANNNVNGATPIIDARPMLYRLGSGGNTPNINNYYNFPQGQFENLTGNVFAGGDKQFQSEKDWKNAVMTRLLQIGGGQYWYGPTADRNVTFVGTGALMADGEYFTWSGTNLTWQGLVFIFDDSSTNGVYYNTVADQTTNLSGLTDLADGDCIYVDLQRQANTTNLVVTKSALSSLWASTSPTYAGNRTILAWRYGSNVYARGSRWPVGQTFVVATPSVLGIVKLFQTSATPGAPVVLNLSTTNTLAWTTTGAVGLAVTSETGGTAIQGTGGAGGGVGVYAVGALTYAGLQAQGGTGEAIYAIGGAPNGDGIISNGDGTGVGIQATAGGGSTVAVLAIGGGVQVPAANDFTYTTAKTYRVMIAAADMHADNSATLQIAEGNAPGSATYWAAGGGTTKLTGVMKGIPPGASITNIYVNWSPGGALTLNWSVNAWYASALTGAYSAVNLGTNNIVAGGAGARRDQLAGIAFSMLTQDTTAFGFCEVAFSCPGTANFYAVYIEYTTVTNPACYA